MDADGKLLVVLMLLALCAAAVFIVSLVQAGIFS